MYRKMMMTLCIGMIILGLSITAYSEPKSDVGNVAFGKTVAGKGEFFTGGFGALQVVDFSTLTDGVFFPPGQNWTEGTVWWDEFMDSIQNYLIVYLGDTCRVTKIVTQLDSNDDYIISWNDLKLGPQEITVVAPSTPGGVTPPIEITIDAITDAFRIEADVGGRGDGYYSISEFQAYSGSIVIGNCDTGVADQVIGDSYTISDQIAECAENARNHGKFVSCVAHLTNNLKKIGIITWREKHKILSCAAKANIP